MNLSSNSPARVPSRFTVISWGEWGTVLPVLVRVPMNMFRLSSALSQLNAGGTRVMTPQAPTSKAASCLRWVMIAVE